MRFARIGAAALLAWMGAGCASLPAPLAPAARPPYSALELQRRIEASDVAHLAFADDAIPRTTAGEEVRGRAAIQDHLLSDGTSAISS